MPNGTQDEIRESANGGHEYIKRVSEAVILNGSLDWGGLLESGATTYRVHLLTANVFSNALNGTANSGYALSTDGDFPITATAEAVDAKALTFISGNNCYLRLLRSIVDAQAGADTLTKIKAYLNLYPITLTHQLSTPTVYRMEAQGNLLAQPNGTIFVEPVIRGTKKPSAGIIIVTDANYPITSIEKVERIDVSDAGYISYTDVTSSCSITGSNTTITISGADNTKQYIYTCLVNSAYTTIPTMDLEVPKGIQAKFGVASHDYEAAAADWTLSVIERNAMLLVVTNAGGAANIIAPDAEGSLYAVNNGSGQAITIKISGGTGVTITNGKTAIVQHNGTDYIKISEEV